MLVFIPIVLSTNINKRYSVGLHILFNHTMQLPVDYDSLAPHEKRPVREEYVRLQGGKCAHCAADLTGPPPEKIAALWINRKLFPETFFKWPVHLHHDHDTGLTIGAVHNTCNAVLWQYQGK